MTRYFSAVLLALFSLLAQASETAAEVPPPVVDADPTAMIVFFLLLLGSTVWYVWFIWSKEKQRKQQDSAAK